MAIVRQRGRNLKLNRRASNLGASSERELTVTALSFSTAAGRALYLDSVAPSEARRGLSHANYAVRIAGDSSFVITARSVAQLVAITEVIVRAFWSMGAYVGFWWRHAGMTQEELLAFDRENRAMTLRIWPDCEA
jgi:hypothetical protein